MYINELAKMTPIEVEASKETKTISLDTEIAVVKAPEDLEKLEEVKKAKPNAKFAVLNPIRREEKLINFVSEYVNCNMIAIVDGDKPVIWRNVTIINMRLPVYGSVHIVLNQREGTAHNRRQHYRLTLDCDGIIKIRTQEKETVVNVFVKDLSETGIGFLIKGEQGLSRGSGCLLEFKDGGQEFHLDLVVIRVQPAENGKFIMGCKIRQRTASITKYINQKQKDRIKGAG